MNTSEIKKHLYNDSTESALKYVDSIKDEETLFVYANNYNWDNGFEIPTSIINNPVCSLSVALLLFHLANGLSYLETKSPNKNLPEWSVFVTLAYDKIMAQTFPPGKVAFTPELSKVQLFKLKKSLPECEHFFIDAIEGIDCNILL